MTLVESDGKEAAFELVENMINDFMNEHTGMDGIFTEDMEADFVQKGLRNEKTVCSPKSESPSKKANHL